MNFMMIIQLVGGLAFFLYGMQVTSRGLQSGSGSGLTSLISRMTSNKPKGVFLGILVTLFTQSSSATSVILVSLVNTSIISLLQSLPVLLGAGIGTTLTVQLIAFRFFDYALILVAIGAFLIISGKRSTLKSAGEILLGFGLIFYGMKVMSVALAPLRSSPELQQILLYFKNNPWLALGVSTLFTAIVQSSGATIAILISFSIQGTTGGGGTEFLSAVMPMIFGANLGTCITAFLGSIGTKRAAKRVAIAQVLQKLTGVILFMFLIPILSKLVHSIYAGSAARQLANAHTVFNLAITLLLVPFVKQFAWLVEKILPIREEEIPFTPLYLDMSLINTPDIALDHARREILRQGRIVEAQLGRVIHLFDRGQRNIIEYTQLEDDKADLLQKAASRYLNTILSGRLDERLSVYAEVLFYINTDLESMGDIIVKNIVPLAVKLRRKRRLFSERGWKEIKSLHATTQRQLELFLNAFQHKTAAGMINIIHENERIQKKVNAFRRSHLKRLIEGQLNSLKTSSIHLDVLDNLRSINHSITALCYYFIDRNTEKKKTGYNKIW